MSTFKQSLNKLELPKVLLQAQTYNLSFDSSFATHFVIICSFCFSSQNKNLPIENTTDCLSTMASVCKVMLETQ